MEIALLITKILLTIFVIVLIPIYWKTRGFQHFIWVSDVTLFLTLIAFWLNSSLLISIIVLIAFMPEFFWNLDFFFQLTTRHTLLGITNYMFDSNRSLFLRSLSLFHVALPPLWIWGLILWGYDKTAPFYGTLLLWAVLLITFFFTDPQRNINWIFLPRYLKWDRVPSFAWLLVAMIVLPVLMIWPLHILLSKIMLP